MYMYIYIYILWIRHFMAFGQSFRCYVVFDSTHAITGQCIPLLRSAGQWSPSYPPAWHVPSTPSTGVSKTKKHLEHQIVRADLWQLLLTSSPNFFDGELSQLQFFHDKIDLEY